MKSTILKLNYLLICFCFYINQLGKQPQAQDTQNLPNIIFILVDDNGLLAMLNPLIPNQKFLLLTLIN